MLSPTPRAAKFPHQAFALAPAAVDEARRLGHLVADRGARGATPEIARWTVAAVPAEDDRRSPLDPRVVAMVERIRTLALPEGEAREKRAAALAAWSPAPRDVWRSAEAHVASRVLRLERLVELDAPGIIVEMEAEGLAVAIGRLDGSPRTLGRIPEDDPDGITEVVDGITRHARRDLSLGTHTETLRTLGFHDPGLGLDAFGLHLGEPLVPFPLLDARARADEGDAIPLGRLRFWKICRAADFAEAALELGEMLRPVSAAARAHLVETLDPEFAEALEGRDYVASAEARLREIAEDATAAEREGLLVLTEVAEDIAY